jgi:uncharacterized membrane protein
LGQNKNGRSTRRADNGKEEGALAPGEATTAGSGISIDTQGTGRPAEHIDRGRPDATDFVEVLPDVLGLLTESDFAPETAEKTRKQRRLTKVVHIMLVLGLASSTVAMGAGLILSLVLKTPLPSEALPLGQVIQAVKKPLPSGFLSLGLLLLVATPILRVFGTLIMFICTREWRYVLVTLLVLIILSLGITAGGG